MKPREPCKGPAVTGWLPPPPRQEKVQQRKPLGPKLLPALDLTQQLTVGHLTVAHSLAVPALQGMWVGSLPSPSSPVSSSGRICCGAEGRLCGLKGRRLAGGLSALVTALARQV